MNNPIATLALPGILALCLAAPAAAQVRLGLNIGPLSIRVAPDRPPPLRAEVRPGRPDRHHIWIQGSWDRQNDQWAWAPGRWERPEQRGSSWVRPRYRKEGGAYRYEPGHWSHQRLVEGDDYRRWNEDHGRNRGRGRGRGHQEGRDQDRH